MAKYVTMARRPRGMPDWADDRPLLPALNVYEPEDEPIDTGLVDEGGRPIYRLVERRRIGF